MKIGCVIVLGLLALWHGLEASPVVRTPYLAAGRRAAPPEGEDAPVPPQLSPYLAFRPFLPAKPTFKPPLVDPNTFIDQKAALLNSLFSPTATASPNYFTAKKTQFLNALFSGLAAQSSEPAGSQTVKRDLSEIPDESPSSSGPAVVASPFAAKKSTFLEKLFKILNLTEPAVEDSPVTAKPTIVPPGFWFPAESPVTPKPTIVPSNFWAPSAGSFPTVPLTKSPSIVDPKIFIDKKTKFLNTLFSNLAVPSKPAGIPPPKSPIVPPTYWIPPSKPDTTTVYQQKVSDFLDKLFNSLNLTSKSVNESAGAVSKDDSATEAHSSVLARRFIGAPMSMWGAPSFIPAVSPKVFIDKKTEFLGKLFTRLSTPAPTEEEDPVDVKPTIVPPNFWFPFASGAVDAPESSPTVKPTIVPPSFWSPFAAVNTVPAAKPAPVVDPSDFINKKAQFLDTLFNSLNAPPTTTTTEAPAVVDDANDADAAELVNVLASILQSGEPAGDISKRNNVHADSNEITLEELPADEVSKRALDESVSPENPLLAAKDKMVNSIITELGGIKDEMMTTVNEIIKQKQDVVADAAASNPYAQFGAKSPFGFGGGKMFGPSKKGGPALGKKGEKTAATDSKKKVSPAFGSKYSFWEPTPTPDPTLPLQQRLEFLNQVFEMLTKLQQDVSSAVSEAATPTTPGPADDEEAILNQIKKFVDAKNLTTTLNSKFISSKSTREIQPGSDAPSSSPNLLTPSGAATKQEEDARRSIKMAVHQGYQSLPPGTEETIETGGGSETDEHEGGGLKLQIKVPV